MPNFLDFIYAEGLNTVRPDAVRIAGKQEQIMKINTKLKMAVLAPALMAFIVSLTLVFSHVEMKEVQENGDIVRRIRNSLTEINVLVQYICALS